MFEDMTDATRNASRTRHNWAGEASGSLGDLGTFVPHVLGALTVVGLAPFGVLIGFGAFLLATGLFYALPIAVQPMKAVSAVMLTGQLGPGEVAATGLVIGAVFLVLGLTGGIGWLARLIPRSVTAGLQLGLGLSMVVLGAGMMAQTPVLAAVAMVIVVAGLILPRLPAAPLAIVATVAIAWSSGLYELPAAPAFGWSLPGLTVPTWAEVVRAIELGVVPQLPLTFTNAIIVTAALARDLFPDGAARVTERNLSLSTGIANLALAPLGAMPMCHGAGGLQAQYRFGARTGWAPVILGVALIVFALGFSDGAAALLGAIPTGAVGALLVVAGGDLAMSRRLFDSRVECWPSIAVAAALTLFVNPAAGLAGGWAIEVGRTIWVRARARKTS